MDAERTLVAIMLADIAGYSALMERDETRTFLRLQELHEKIISPRVKEYGGRIIKTTGDGFLAVFPSATACLGCGVAIQRMNLAQEANKDEQERFHLRMGINLGDVIVDGEDVSGNGVNVAARLEPLSPLDGICVSGAVRDQVREDIGIVLEDIGEQRVKNITRPIRAYRIYVNGKGNGGSVQSRKKRKPATYLSAAFSLLALLGVSYVLKAKFWPDAAAPVEIASDQTIRSAAAAQEIPLPDTIEFSQPRPGLSKNAIRYLGAWSSGDSRFNGVSRKMLLLVENIDPSGAVSGEWGFSGPNVHTARQNPAGYAHFYGKVTDNGLSFSLGTSGMLCKIIGENSAGCEFDGIGDHGVFHSSIGLMRLK